MRPSSHLVLLNSCKNQNICWPFKQTSKLSKFTTSTLTQAVQEKPQSEETNSPWRQCLHDISHQNVDVRFFKRCTFQPADHEWCICQRSTYRHQAWLLPWNASLTNLPMKLCTYLSNLYVLIYRPDRAGGGGVWGGGYSKPLCDCTYRLAGMFSYSFSVSAHPAVMIFPPNNKNKFQISLTSSQILAPPHTSLVPTEHKCNMGSIAASFSDDMQQRREELVL